MVWRYWKTAAIRAARDAFQVLWGLSREAILLAVLIAATYLSLVYITRGGEDAKSELIDQMLTWASPFIWFPLFYLWHLIKAPAVLAAENQATSEDTIHSLQNQLNVALAKTPRLQGIVEQSMCGVDPEAQCMSFFLNMTIRNVGIPTAILTWAATCTVRGRNVQCRPFAFPGTVTFQSGRGPISLSKNDQIIEKAINPVPTGGFVRGWYCVDLLGISSEEARDPSLHIEVKFQDTFGEWNSAHYEHSGPARDHPKYYADGSGGWMDRRG